MTSRSDLRRRSGDPGVSRASGLDVPSAVGKRSKGRAGVEYCMTCGARYDVTFVDGLPRFWNHGTKEPHRCKTP